MGCPGCLGCDAHLEAAFEDRVGGTGIEASVEEGRETDSDLEEWLAARLEELEERRFALFDLETERR
ncbi:MAG: hypothetical protein ACR2OO_06220 [Thermomicrobiales bacterium]